jgi:hypothetical protein
MTTENTQFDEIDNLNCVLGPITPYFDPVLGPYNPILIDFLE